MCLFIFFIIFRQNFFCLAYIEFRIRNVINLRIILCIVNGLRYNLYTIYLLCFLRKEQGNVPIPQYRSHTVSLPVRPA